MKLANPLNFPIAVLAGGLILVVGVRLLRLPNLIVIPAAIGTTLGGAALLKARQPPAYNLDDPELDRELQTLRQAALDLSQKATSLRTQAAHRLTDSLQMELLAAVQLCCDRADALPAQVAELAQRLQHSSILSVAELQTQQAAVQRRLATSSGAAQTHLEQLARSLERNLQLARAGQDTRYGQVVNLSTLIQDSAGTLQRLQTQLLSADVNDPDQLSHLQALSNELMGLQAGMEVLVRR